MEGKTRSANASHAVSYLDLEIRIFPYDENAAGYPVEITLDGQQEFPRGYLPGDLLPWVTNGDLTADGYRLFAMLMADPMLRSAWAEARGRSAQRRIRLWIDVNAPELHTIPWELLREGDAMIASQAATPFLRYLPVPHPWGSTVRRRPLRVLVVLSNPADLDRHNKSLLDVELERRILKETFAKLPPGKAHVRFLPPPVTLERLEQELRQGARRSADGYHVLHYLGHGAFDERSGRAVLYLEDASGWTQEVSDADIVSMLQRQSQPPRLIFLATCQSATRSTTDAFLGLAPRLVAAGVPATVAMQDHVSVDTARKLSVAFYRQLLTHGEVDRAINEARSTLLTAGRPDAAAPVLLMRLKDGRLWSAVTGIKRHQIVLVFLVLIVLYLGMAWGVGWPPFLRWKRLPGAPKESLSALAVSGDHLYVGSYDYGLARADAQGNWSDWLIAGLPTSSPGVLTELHSNVPAIDALKILPAPAKRVYAFVRNHGLFYLENTTSTWMPIGAGQTLTQAHAFDIEGQIALIITAQREALVSPDGGQTWQTLNGDYGLPVGAWATAHFAPEGTPYLGGEEGLYRGVGTFPWQWERVGTHPVQHIAFGAEQRLYIAAGWVRAVYVACYTPEVGWTPLIDLGGEQSFENTITTLTAHPDDPNRFYAGTIKRVYELTCNGEKRNLGSGGDGVSGLVVLAAEEGKYRLIQASWDGLYQRAIK